MKISETTIFEKKILTSFALEIFYGEKCDCSYEKINSPWCLLPVGLVTFSPYFHPFNMPFDLKIFGQKNLCSTNDIFEQNIPNDNFKIGFQEDF